MRCISLCATIGGLTTVAGAQLLLNEELYFTTVISGLSEPVSFEFVSDTTMLIIEKNSGKVKKYVDGAYIGDALDLVVANDGEMGLLGIAKDPSFENNGYIYLLYSRAAIEGGDWLDDRIVRYTYNGTTLTSPMNLWVMGTTATFPTGEIYHHGGYMRIGPDGKLYVQRGDMLRWGSMEMNNNINIIGEAGAIFRLNLDGSAPVDNPFFGHPHPSVQKIWLYGFRNGYGMAFDRSTGNLWFSENGPNIYDEINIARPGMNSGWRLIMGPDSRNATYPNNNNTPYNANQLVYLTGAEYYDPVFSYLEAIGLCGFGFFSSPRFLESPTVFDNAITGCTNTGNMYMLPVSANRMGVSATGSLSDLVADTPVEREQWALGQNWGFVTDMKIGPDGYMYLCTLNMGGAIRRIRPVADAVVPYDTDVVRGVITAGDTGPTLVYSDNNRLVLRPGIVFTTAQSPVHIGATGTSPYASPAALNFVVEASASSPAIDLIVQMFNFKTGVWQVAQTIDLTLADTKYTVSVPGSPADFIESGTNRMAATISMRAAGPVFAYPWNGNVDMVHWTSVRP